RLLRNLGLSAGSWIGQEIIPTDQQPFLPENNFVVPERSEFEEIQIDSFSFLKHARSEFIEFDSAGQELDKAEFEYLVPRNFSKNTVATIPFIKCGGDFFVGIEFRDLPAAQRFSGNSNLACIPAWRLPKTIEHKFDISQFVCEKFPIDFKTGINNYWELG